jgi:hypothetical protein
MTHVSKYLEKISNNTLTCSPQFRLLNQPMYLSSPIIVDNAKLASCNAFDVHLDIAECNALNHIKASCGSDAFKIHE